MINLKKHDNVADAVKEILQQEALKGNQGAIDANHNGEVDAQDFKILRAKKKKVKEEIEQQDEAMSHQAATTMKHIPNASPALKNAAKDIKPGVGGYRDRVAMLKAGGIAEEIDINDRTKDTLVGREKTKQKDDVGPNSNAKVSKFKLKSEEAEQIDELSINTLTRVKHAATSAASDASREGDEGKATKRYDLAGKASNKIETKNRTLGLKPSGQHAFEEVEQIDIEEGAKETAQKALNLADKLRKKDPEKSKMYRNLGIKASQRSNNPTGVKSGQPHGSGNKALRKQGIEPVPSSISSSKMRGYFEEVEQIDEISTSTLGSYLDKRKSEYMKGKTQSGSKENAKKIQNMGKAYDKIKVQDLAKARQNNMEEVEQIDEYGEPSKYDSFKKNVGVYSHPAPSKELKKNVGVYSHPAPSKELKKNVGSPPHKIGPTLKQMKERMEEPILDELINEVMSKDASAGDWIHDFIHSDNPKFAGKSDAKRKEMALAAYYSKKNEEAVNEGLKDMAKKTFKALTGGSDKDHLDRLKKDMYGGSEVKYAAKTLVKHAKDPLGLKKEEVEQIDELSKNTLLSYRVKSIGRSGEFEKKGYEAAKKDGGAGNEKSDKLFNKADSVATARKRAQEKMREDVVEEGWDDMVKAAQEKVKSGPKPSGGSGKKEGSRYGGSKQKEKPEQEVKEAKDPTMDAGCGSAPNFATDATKPMQAAQTMAKKSLARMRSDMMAKSGK